MHKLKTSCCIKFSKLTSTFQNVAKKWQRKSFKAFSWTYVCMSSLQLHMILPWKHCLQYNKVLYNATGLGLQSWVFVVINIFFGQPFPSLEYLFHLCDTKEYKISATLWDMLFSHISVISADLWRGMLVLISKDFTKENLTEIY